MFDAAKNSPNMFKGKLRYMNVETTINAIAQYGCHFQLSTVHNQLYHETLTDWLPLWKNTIREQSQRFVTFGTSLKAAVKTQINLSASQVDPRRGMGGYFLIIPSSTETYLPFCLSKNVKEVPNLAKLCTVAGDPDNFCNF